MVSQFFNAIDSSSEGGNPGKIHHCDLNMLTQGRHLFDFGTKERCDELWDVGHTEMSVPLNKSVPFSGPVFPTIYG